MRSFTMKSFRAILTAIICIASSIAVAETWSASFGQVKGVDYVESYVSNVIVNGSSVVNDKVATISVPVKVGDLQNDVGYVTDSQITNIAFSAIKPVAAESVEQVMTEMLGADWKTKYGTGAAGIIASILAAIAYLKLKKQDVLVGTQTTGQNLKTVNGNNLLGSGNVTIEASTAEAAFDPTGTDEVGNKGNTPTVSTKMITPRNAPYAVTWGMIHAASGNSAKTHSFTTLEKERIHDWLGVNQLTFVISDGKGGTTTKTLNVVSNEA